MMKTVNYMFEIYIAYSMEEAVMTQMESLYHTENSHYYQHPFSGQCSAHRLSSIPAVPSFSNCLVHGSLMLAQKQLRIGWQRFEGSIVKKRKYNAP